MEDRIVDVDQVRKGRTMLWIALAGSIVLVPTLLSNKATVLFLIAWVASFFGGIGGIREVARGTQGSALLMYGAMVLVFMPVINVVPIGLYLLVARGALREDLDPAPEPERPAVKAAAARPIAAQPPKSGEQTASRSAFQTPSSPEQRSAVAAIEWSRQRIQAGGAAAFVSSAIACIKHAGLRSADGGDLKEGSRLGIRPQLPDGAKLSPQDEPVMLVAHGTFGVVYMVDLGEHYTWVTVGQLMEGKVTLAELHRIGLKNLERETKELIIAMGDNAYMMTMGGQFEASLLLVDSVWDKTVAEYTPNGAVATIPARDMCVFCDSRSAEGLGRVQAVATNPLADASHALTQKLFARRDGRWREFTAVDPRDAPLEFKV